MFLDKKELFLSSWNSSSTRVVDKSIRIFSIQPPQHLYDQHKRWYNQIAQDFHLQNVAQKPVAQKMFYGTQITCDLVDARLPQLATCTLPDCNFCNILRNGAHCNPNMPGSVVDVRNSNDSGMTFSLTLKSLNIILI